MHPVRLLLLAGGWAVLLAACADERSPERGAAGVAAEDPSIVLEGIVYIPAFRDPEGCILYRMRVPGGAAPAALFFRTADGQFSIDRPDPCATSAEVSR